MHLFYYKLPSVFVSSEFEFKVVRFMTDGQLKLIIHNLWLTIIFSNIEFSHLCDRYVACKKKHVPIPNVASVVAKVNFAFSYYLAIFCSASADKCSNISTLNTNGMKMHALCTKSQKIVLYNRKAF